MGNLIDRMKERIASSGESRRDILYFAADSIRRVRFLTELDEGYIAQIHSKYAPQQSESVFALCDDPEDHEDCEYCKEQIPIQEWYCWSVWDYDDNAVRLIVQKASGITPVVSFIEMYEEFGTIKDRDYKIKKVGKGTTGSFVVTPLDKSVYKNKKAKPFTDSEIQDILNRAYGKKKNSNAYDDSDDEEEEEEKPIKKAKKKKAAKSIRERLEELDINELKEICVEFGMSKKEIRQFEDEDEIIDELVDNYEEDDIADVLEEIIGE